MKAQELTIEVKTILSISDEAAKRCIQLLEMWMDDNPCKTILVNKQPNGKTTIEISDNSIVGEDTIYE